MQVAAANASAEESNEVSHSKNVSGKEEENVEGKLKMAHVLTLPDDAEEVIGQLSRVDFGKQDLDILIALSKQLKQKRQQLFPDTSYVQNL